MIKVFRKIRQQLLSKNNVSKPASPAGRYLLYAIGEIILVVIGILIALQINNANENRKKRISEQIILKGLKEDFLVNQESIKIALAKHNYHLNELTEYLKHLGPNVPALTDSIYKFDVSDYVTLNLTNGTLLSVINTDKIEILQNEQLKSKLSTYPSTFANYREYEDVNKDIVINKHRALGERYTSIIRLDSALLSKSEQHPSDFLGWARNPQHQNNTVNRILIMRNRLIPALIMLQVHNSEVLKLVEKEIWDK